MDTFYSAHGYGQLVRSSDIARSVYSRTKGLQEEAECSLHKLIYGKFRVGNRLGNGVVPLYRIKTRHVYSVQQSARQGERIHQVCHGEPCVRVLASPSKVTAALTHCLQMRNYSCMKARHKVTIGDGPIVLAL